MEKCCAECPEPRAGHSLCTHCNKWLCFQCTDLHAHGRSSTHSQRGTSPPETGSACCEHAVVMCPLHKQETLGLLCETCDLMTCSICHLSAHKDHRLVHVTKALQDQQWLLENLMARVEEKRSAVENTAKQIQGRLHGVKITQRKAENQIKMAKMIMMNELNKRAKLLIEQLEGVSSSFKQHLEDQLQGAIELCSQLEHVQNFITWAMANHRRNPLLFSKELMQQFLEPLQYSETWTPLKVKFNWDASFWTKQISTLGQLSVEGGSHPYSEAAGPRLPYSEAAGRTGILRPQPVSCRAVPSLCHPVREADCAYQAFCQPQLCCVHCRAAQSLSLDKYTCSQHPSSSAPAVQGPVQRSWDLESSSLAPPPLVRLQRSSPPSPSTGALRQQGPHIPQPRHELPATPEQAAPSSRATGLRQRSGSQEGEPTATPTPIATPTPATEQQLLPQRQQQLDEASGQRSAASSPSPEHPCEPRVPSSKAVRTTSPHTDMHAPASACGADVLNPASPEETGRSRSGTQPGSGMRGGGPDVNAQRLVMGAEEMEHVTLQECGRPSVADSMVTPAQTQTHPPSSLTTYKTEPDVYTYTDNTDKCRTRSGASREVQDSSSREVNDTSKVPVVCLERLNTVIPRQAPQGEQSAALSRDSGLKAERSACVELGREHVAEGVSREEAVECLPGGAPVRGTSPAPPGPGVELQERTAPDTPHAPSSGPSPCPDSEGENASDQTEHNPSEPKSGPVSDSLLESATEADLGSEAEVESELQAESDPSLESEARVDSDSDLEWEQPPDSELLAESERDLVSDPDSAAEVSLSLEQEGEWGAGQGGGSEPRAGPSTAAQPPEEMESEDFCAVCLIGGDLLCCDRCPKVFHLACHVPSLLSFPSGDWVCTLCRDVDWPEVEYDSEDARLHTDAAPSGLSACERRKCEKLILHIYSNILSTPFHEPVSPLARHYYQIIRRPMDLSVIRSRLCESSSTHYSSPSEFVADVLLMFKNCAKFNYPDSEVAQAGRNLQAFFRTKLREVFPSLSCPSPQDDSDSEEAEEAEREAAAAGFPWPERREQNHRKRKRRPSLSWRRHHY